MQLFLSDMSDFLIVENQNVGNSVNYFLIILISVVKNKDILLNSVDNFRNVGKNKV